MDRMNGPGHAGETRARNEARGANTGTDEPGAAKAGTHKARAATANEPRTAATEAATTKMGATAEVASTATEAATAEVATAATAAPAATATATATTCRGRGGIKDESQQSSRCNSGEDLTDHDIAYFYGGMFLTSRAAPSQQGTPKGLSYSMRLTISGNQLQA
jgi:hypothetical protein